MSVERNKMEGKNTIKKKKKILFGEKNIIYEYKQPIYYIRFNI